MSANINYNQKTKRYSFVTAKEPAWHNLGTIFNRRMTTAEAIELAGLDYTVRKDRVAVKFDKEISEANDGIKGKFIPGTFATYRTDTLDVFGIVGNNYTIVQNKDAFKFIDSIVGYEGTVIETAGALGKGETIFITVKLPINIKVNGYDTIENYLVISNSHDGRSSLNIFLTPIRVVCQNTLSYGLSNSRFNVVLRHTQSISDKMLDAREVLSISNTIAEEYREVFKMLSNIKVTDKLAKDYFNHIFLSKDEVNLVNRLNLPVHSVEDISTRKKNILSDVYKYYEIGVGQDKIKGTAYGLYNAVTGYLSNVKSYSNNDEKKMRNLVLGGSDSKLNVKALQLATTVSELMS